MVLLSTNECPNSGPDTLQGRECAEGTLTTYGYCSECWAKPCVISPTWTARANADHRRQMESLLA